MRRNERSPAMRVAMVFGGSVIAERTLDSPTEVTLGDGPSAIMPLPSGVTSSGGLTLLREHADGGWELTLHPSMGGAIWLEGERRAVASLDEKRVRLGEADYGVVTTGNVAFFFQRVGAASSLSRRWLSLDANAYAALGLSTFLHLAAMLLLFLAQREAPVSMMSELPTDLLRRFVVSPPAATVTPPAPEEVAHDAFVEPTGGGDEGAPSPERGDRARQTPRPHPRAASSSDDRVSQIGLLGALNGGDGGSDPLAALHDGPDIAGLLSDLRVGGDRVGPGRGLGLRDGGRGRGPGVRRGPGDSNTRVGDDRARDEVERSRGRAHREQDLDFPPQPPQRTGDYPPDQIQRVVMRNRMQIRYCYENELQRRPGLRGRVEVSWRILPSGEVGDARIAASTMGSAAVEGCIVRQIRRWRFPPPREGQVEVRYPFLLGLGR
ncbi:MAG: TonB family protein [Sandaracinaceae bacterium]